jgi:hypothetical protein
MSPAQIDFVGKPFEKVCEKIYIKTEGLENLTGSIRWAKKGYSERNLLKHNLNSEALDLEVEFPERIFLKGQKQIEICILGEEGKYHGILLYKIEGKNLQMGIWLNVNFEKQKYSFIKNILDSNKILNPLFVGKVSINKKFSRGEFLILTAIILIAILVFLLNRKKEFKNEFSNS